MDDAEGLGWVGAGGPCLMDVLTPDKWRGAPPGTETNGLLYGVHHGKASLAEVAKRFAFLVEKSA